MEMFGNFAAQNSMWTKTIWQEQNVGLHGEVDGSCTIHTYSILAIPPVQPVSFISAITLLDSAWPAPECANPRTLNLQSIALRIDKTRYRVYSFIVNYILSI